MSELLELGLEAEEGLAELHDAAYAGGVAGVALVVDLDEADVEALVAEGGREVGEERVVVLGVHECDGEAFLAGELEGEVHQGCDVALGREGNDHGMGFIRLGPPILLGGGWDWCHR